MEWKEVFCLDYILCFLVIVKYDFKIGFDWLLFIINYYIFIWKVKVLVVVKFIIVKLNFEFFLVFKDKLWVGIFVCNWMYLSVVVDVLGVFVICCFCGVIKIVILNRFIFLIFIVFDCVIVFMFIVFILLVLKCEVIIMWFVVFVFVFRERLKGMM